jgi:probable rRNA maturation factor
VEIEVEISDTQDHLRLAREELADLVRRVLDLEGHTHGSISIALVDQATIHALNRTHLGHDWPTDVLSFPLSNPDDRDLTGELIVSAEMALTTAREIGVEPSHELALYIVHGLLHLCGYDDSVEPDAGRMRRREDEILADLGIPNPFKLAGPAPVQRRSHTVGPALPAGPDSVGPALPAGPDSAGPARPAAADMAGPDPAARALPDGTTAPAAQRARPEPSETLP